MKKILSSITVVFAILNATSSFAQVTTSTTTQTDSREDLRFGVKAGINIANVYDEDGNDFVADNKVGLAAGAFVSIPLGKFIGFQPEVMYSEKGYKTSGSVLGFNYDYKQTSAYLDIPLQLQIKPIESVTILVGPQYSYLLSTKYDFNGDTTTAEEDQISSDNYKKNIFGFVVGADFNYENFIISARGGWDITKSDSDGDTTHPRYKNQVIQFTLGYAF